MNRLSRAGIAVVVLASALWAGGVAEAVQVPSAATVCVNASSGVVSLMRYETMYCSTQDWSQSKPAPPLCWNDSSVVRKALRRSISIAPSTGCAAPLRSVPADEVLLLCGDGLSGVLRWPATGNCLWYNEKTWIRSASASNVATTTPISSNTSTPTATTAVVVPKVSLTPTWIQSITFPKAVTVTANVAGTIYFAEGAFVVKTVSDITSAPSYRWAKGTVTSANTPTSIAIDVDALANGYYRVFVANSQGVLSEPATNIVTISVPPTPTAAEIAAGTTTTSTTIALTCATGGSCAVGEIGPGGGKVFYAAVGTFASPGSACNTAGVGGISTCKYLEAAPTTGGSAWTDVVRTWATTAKQNSAVIGADGTAIGTGYQNTSDIAAQAGNDAATSAAVEARAYRGPSNFSDWFLPSKDELNELCKYARNTGQAAGGGIVCTGGSSATARGFENANHWSSSEGDFNFAWIQAFWSGDQNGTGKGTGLFVRPVRAF